MTDHLIPSAQSASPSHPTGPPATTSDTILLALYSENGEIARTMVEWRHKLILLFVVTVGALATAGTWLHEHRTAIALRWELIVGSLVMCLFVLMEQRTTLILHACYSIGSRIEADLARTSEPAIYSTLHTTQSNLITYSNLLRATYLATAVALAVFAFYMSN
jgi:hypothetical protein